LTYAKSRAIKKKQRNEVKIWQKRRVRRTHSAKICLKHRLSLTCKGKTFNGKEREETTAYKKEQYRLLQRAEQGEVKSYVQDSPYDYELQGASHESRIVY